MIRSMVGSISLIICAISLARGQALDQSKCVLNLGQSPSIRGLRLGMSASDVLAFFPESSFNRNAVASAQDEPNFGVARLFFQISQTALPANTSERFAGIEIIHLVLFDGRLAELKVNYAGANSQPNKGPYWRNVDEFVNRLSGALGLPPGKDWVDRDQLSKVLRCTGFTFTASVEHGGAGSIVLRVATAYEDTLRQRAVTDQERKRREFKP